MKFSLFPFLPAFTAALAALSACSPLQTPFDTPEKAAREFHRRLLLGDCKKAFELLDVKTQTRLREKAKTEAERAGSPSKEPEMMICQGDPGIYGRVNLSGDDVVAVRLMETNDDGSVTIGVSIRGKEWPTRLVREEARGQWSVDLSGINMAPETHSIIADSNDIPGKNEGEKTAAGAASEPEPPEITQHAPQIQAADEKAAAPAQTAGDDDTAAGGQHQPSQNPGAAADDPPAAELKNLPLQKKAD